MIDGKEAITTIEVTQETLEQLSGTLQKIQGPNPLKDFSKDLVSVNASAEDAVQGIMDFIKYNGLSESAISSVINQLEEEKKVLGVMSAEYKSHTSAIANLNQAYQLLTGSQRQIPAQGKQMVTASNSMTMAIDQFGWALSDADMFTVNFRMGLRSVANNIPMVVQYLGLAANEAKRTGVSFMDLAKNSIMGGGGILLAVNLLMFAMQVLPTLFDSGTEAAKRQKDAIDELKKSYDNLTKAEIEKQLIEYQKQLDELAAKHPKTVQVNYGKGEIYTETAATEEIQYGADWANVKALRDRTKALNELLLNYGQLEEAQKNLTLLQKEQEKLNENKGSEYYWQKIIPKAKDFEEAKKVLQQWIAYQQAAVNELKGKQTAATGNSNLPQWMGNQAQTLEAERIADEKIIADKDNANKDYLQLNEELEAAEKEHEAIMLRVKGATSEASYQSAMKEKSDNDIKIKSIKDTMKVEEDAADKSIEAWRKERDEKVKTETEANKFNEDERRQYYDKMKFMDAGYYSYRLEQIDDDLRNFKAAGASELQLAEYRNIAKKQLDKEYFEWRWEQYKKDNQIVAGSLDAMWKGWDTFFNTLADRSISGSERLQKVWEAIEGGFIDMLANIAKAYLQGLIERAILSKTFQAADITAAIGMGTAMASAYAPAAAFASIMSFGAADIAGSTGLAATTALAYLLSSPKIPGFEKGTMGIVGEKGPEIIAPLHTYAEGQAQLILQTLSTVKNEIRSGALMPGISAGVSSSEIEALRQEVKGLREDFRTGGIRARAYLDDKEAKNVGNSWYKQTRKSNI